jgi:hypothetical protein
MIAPEEREMEGNTDSDSSLILNSESEDSKRGRPRHRGGKDREHNFGPIPIDGRDLLILQTSWPLSVHRITLRTA